jgi:hypothetical protein
MPGFTNLSAISGHYVSVMLMLFGVGTLEAFLTGFLAYHGMYGMSYLAFVSGSLIWATGLYYSLMPMPDNAEEGKQDLRLLITAIWPLVMLFITLLAIWLMPHTRSNAVALTQWAGMAGLIALCAIATQEQLRRSKVAWEQRAARSIAVIAPILVPALCLGIWLVPHEFHSPFLF